MKLSDNFLSEIPYLLQKNNFLTKKECEQIIKKYKKICISECLITYLNYNYVDFNFDAYWKEKISNFLNEYIKKYDGINMIEKWTMGKIRFKHFPKNYSFDSWHCEHTRRDPNRVISILIYLSDHEEGTEFYHWKKTIKSKTGKAIMFPASWTHLHRGQKTNKDRYILSIYGFYIN
jgi:hypothetical protein